MIYGLAVNVKTDHGKVTPVSLVVATLTGTLTVSDKLKAGTYYCNNSLALTMAITLIGGRWEVFMGGNAAVFATNGPVKIRSIARFGGASVLTGDTSTPKAEAWQCYLVGCKLRDAIAAYGARPDSGLSAIVRKLAPGLVSIRKHVMTNRLAKKHCFFGGRTEVFKPYAGEPVTGYDIRSAYAWSYKQGIPGDFIGIGNAPAYGDNFLCKCVVSIPRNEHIPAIPYRAKDGTLVFPTGEWETWLCGPEYRIAEKKGWLKRSGKAYLFANSDAMVNLADTVFARRIAATCPVDKNLAKEVLVSAFGMLGANEGFTRILMNPATVPYGSKMIKPGVYETVSKPSISLAHVPAASVVSARVRAKLWEVLSLCGMGGEDSPSAYYCDTDSVFVSSSAIPPTPYGDGLGEWREVGQYASGSMWVAKKTYALGGGAMLRASGVSAHNAAKYLSGEKVSERRVSGIAFTLKKGYATDVPVTMALRTDRDKRIKEGEVTRALTIEEVNRLP